MAEDKWTMDTNLHPEIMKTINQSELDNLKEECLYQDIVKKRKHDCGLACEYAKNNKTECYCKCRGKNHGVRNK